MNWLKHDLAFSIDICFGQCHAFKFGVQAGTEAMVGTAMWPGFVADEWICRRDMTVTTLTDKRLRVKHRLHKNAAESPKQCEWFTRLLNSFRNSRL